jgi:hypothetical protein
VDENKSLGTLAIAALIVGFLHKLGENLADLAAKYLASDSDEEEDGSEEQSSGGGLHVHVHPHVTVEPA